MHFSHALLAASAAASVLALPSLEPRGTSKGGAKVAEYIEACQEASNCETWKDDKGRTRIRFKPGQGPDSEDYNQRINKRADVEVMTQVTMGDEKLSWGCDKDPYLVLGNIEKICADSGACISNSPYEADIRYVQPCDGCTAGPPHDETLSISATGHYPTPLKNGLIEVIRQLGAHKVQWVRDQRYGGVMRKRDNPVMDNPNVDHGGTCDVATQSSFLSVSRYTVINKGKPNQVKNLMGNIDVVVSLPDMSAGACDVLGTTANIGAAISGPIARGDLASVFGVISGFCSAVQ